MAALGFRVHTDKENETPGLLRPIDKNLQGKSLQAFPSKGGSKLTQPTPRKALGSVNNQLHPVSSSNGIKGNVSDFHGPVQALFKSKKSIGNENFPAGHFTKKPKAKSSPVVLPTGLKKSSSHVRCNKTRTPKSKPKSSVEPIPIIPDDVEYDSDTIFPHSDRLSCYVDKLLMWRPPCFFGSAPDSDSDIEEENLDDIIEMDPPPLGLYGDDDQDLPEDLSELLVDLPSPSPSQICSKSSPTRNMSPDLMPLNDQSLDSSLHLGQLHFETLTNEPVLESESVTCF